jgi:hypothetical protein
MCEKSTLELYLERTHRLETQGAELLSFLCPNAACGQEIKCERVGRGEFYTPLSTCPHCVQIFWKIVQHTRACGLIAFRRVSPNAAESAAQLQLSIPSPAGGSLLYTAGWSYADEYTRNGGDLAGECTRKWPEEKANGFWDRLAAEREASG